MRLTFVNFIIKRFPHGYKYRGKHRVVKEVKLPALIERYNEYTLQEQNMLVLRHPYLTVEQSKGHMVGLKEDVKKLWNRRRDEKFSRRFTWAEQLSHLRVRDAWE